MLLSIIIHIRCCLVVCFWSRIPWRCSPWVLRWGGIESGAQCACSEGRGMVENSQSIALSRRGAAQLNVTYLSIIITTSAPPGDKDETNSKGANNAISRASRSDVILLLLYLATWRLFACL